MKKSVSFLLALMLFLLPLLACAESAIQPRYSYIVSPYASLNISGGSAVCTGRGSSSSTQTTTRITVALVRKADDSKFWLPFATWTATSSGISTAYVAKTVSIDSGYTYYVNTYVEILDQNGNVLETGGVRTDLYYY